MSAPRIVVATIDSPSAEVVREALADAGVEAAIIPIKPAHAWMQIVPRPMVDVEVAPGDVEAARRVLAALEDGGEAAAAGQWEGDGAVPPDDEAPRPRGGLGALWRRLTGV